MHSELSKAKRDIIDDFAKGILAKFEKGQMSFDQAHEQIVDILTLFARSNPTPFEFMQSAIDGIDLNG